MNKLISSKTVALAFGVLVISFVVGFYVFAWQEPTQAPPEGNVPTPLNVGPTHQAKEGDLTIQGFLSTLKDFVVGIVTVKSDGSMSPELNSDKLDDYHAADLMAGAGVVGVGVESFQEKYPLMLYTTSEEYNGNLGGFAGYDAKCANDPLRPLGYENYTRWPLTQNIWYQHPGFNRYYLVQGGEMWLLYQAPDRLDIGTPNEVIGITLNSIVSQGLFMANGKEDLDCEDWTSATAYRASCVGDRFYTSWYSYADYRYMEERWTCSRQVDNCGFKRLLLCAAWDTLPSGMK